MAYSLAQAANAVGRDRSTLLRMIKLGRISAERDEVSGSWRIEPGELHRLYPPKAAHAEAHAEAHVDASPRTSKLNGSTGGMQDPVELWKLRIEADQVRIAELTADKEALNRRLDRAEEERRELLAVLSATQAQVKLLTDQRPNGSARAEPDPPRTRWQQFLAWRRGR